MKKNVLKIITILFLFIVYIYILNIISVPNSIVLFEGEKLNFKTIAGLSLENSKAYETALTSVSMGSSVGTDTIDLKLFGKLKVKSVNVNVVPTTKVIPLGQAIGMKLYTKGVLVVGMSEIENEFNTKEKPFANSGIEEGDSIIAVNNKEVSNTNELIDEINNSRGNEINITYLKDNKISQTNITPIKSKGEYKLGLWVRDAAAGVGTLTFYEPSTNMFMSLGHGISDIDTENIVDIASGELVTADILSVVKGKRGIPGEIRGTIQNSDTIGKIYKNTNFGVYGLVTSKQKLKINYQELEVATRSEIQTGKASILCEVDNNGVQEYEIEIQKIYLNDNEDNKSMLIKITDKDLIEKTGGIVQGMSGAPILQNGKFIGAVTNVLVKEPTEGYGVFGDILIKQMRDV